MRVENEHFNPPRVVFCGNYDKPDDEESARSPRGPAHGDGAQLPVERVLV